MPVIYNPVKACFWCHRKVLIFLSGLINVTHKLVYIAAAAAVVAE